MWVLIVCALAVAGVLNYLCYFISSQAERYEQANEEKLRAEHFKSELLASVSHDIRTPLTSIINYTDLLGKLSPPEGESGGGVEFEANFHEYVSVVSRKSARLKTLLNDLIEAAKLTSGNVPVTVENVDLGEIVGQVAGEWDDQFTERGLTLVLRQPEEPVMVEADRNHLWRVLENLFSNVSKYALSGTRVFSEITAPAQDAAATFTLKNTSEDPIDLPAEMLTEQFIRGDRSRHTEGSGLGLYIAKSSVEAMGGTFTIQADGDLFEAQIRFQR
jgi:signal transduction histidine kinase